MNIRRILPVGIMLLVLFCFAGGVAADNSVGDLQSEKSQVQDKIDTKKQELKGVQQKKEATLEDLDALETEIATVGAEIERLSKELADARANLAKQEEELKILEEKLAESQASMKDRVKSIYINGDISYLEVIFNASSINEFLSNFIFVEKIVEQDKSIIFTIEENKRLAKEKYDELQATKSKIEGLKTNKESEEAVYTAQEKEKAAMFAALEQDEASLKQIISEFQQESAAIEAEIKAIYAQQEAAKAAKAKQQQAANGGEGEEGSAADGDTGPTYSGNGQFAHPLGGKGSYSSPYGYRGSEFHTGLDIAAPHGTPVLAAESGRVILVKRLTTSYGQYVVVDHGGGYSTLYAHMSAIYVSVGQDVSRGQQIGAVGSTGRSTGNHLHFEVRINGSTVNPKSYI